MIIFKKQRSARRQNRPVARRSGRRLLVEPLEARRLLTMWTVNDLGDGPIAEDGRLTLREAVLAASLNQDQGDAPPEHKTM